MTLDKYTI